MTLLNAVRPALLAAYGALYARVARPFIFRSSAQRAHDQTLHVLRWLDDHRWTHHALRGLHRFAFPRLPVEVGGVTLPHPFILAAGLVKGFGFADETEALQAAASRNIMPGWRAMPLLVGPVEFGSFTRWPRPGNSGTVVWRDPATRSTQNRVGLKNPGALAAARFLTRHRSALPPVFGLNLAPSPGVDDEEQTSEELAQAAEAFLQQGVVPAWFTVNLSCPNTEDDPGCRQTARAARLSLNRLGALLHEAAVPLWVKLGPALADAQYHALLDVCAEMGVRAIIATNTLPKPVPGNPDLVAGVGGGRLHDRALAALRVLADERARRGFDVDLIGCGGAQDSATCRAFMDAGASAVQYWSVLVYRGPLAAALMLDEMARFEGRASLPDAPRFHPRPTA